MLDYFIFNIGANAKFDINSGANIHLLGDIAPSEVLFNVLGGGGEADAKIQESIFKGTLLTGRNALINDNEGTNFILGAIIADGKLLFAESVITHQPFLAPTPVLAPVPVPAAGLLFGSVLAGGFAFGAWRRWRVQKSA